MGFRLSNCTASPIVAMDDHGPILAQTRIPDIIGIIMQIRWKFPGLFMHTLEVSSCGSILETELVSYSRLEAGL